MAALEKDGFLANAHLRFGAADANMQMHRHAGELDQLLTSMHYRKAIEKH